MYLMALSNSDYVLATIFFGIMFLIAYLFRRNQQSASKFLFATDEGLITQSNSWILGFGVIELVATGVIGVIYGLSGLYQMIVVAVSSFVAVYYISRGIHPYSIYEYLLNKIGPRFSALYAGLCVLFLLFWLSITVVLTSKLFLSLLGWTFVNSVFGIMVLTIICIEVGGYVGVKYNRNLWGAIIVLAFIFILGLGLYTLSLNESLVNLKQLAANQGRSTDFYTAINYSLRLKNILGASLSILVIIPLITAIKVSHKVNTIPFAILKLVLLVLMVLGGILAIATKPTNALGSGNSKIITYQAQLPDGQMGYVVKSVDVASNDAKTAIPGIIPPLLNDKTSLVEQDKYDYKLANVVVFRHYLPAKFLFLVVLTIMAAFMYTVSHCLLSIAKIITIDICSPLKLLKEYGDEGKLWCSRMSVVFAGSIGIFGGYFLAQWFDLLILSYITFSFAGILILILLSIIILYKKDN